MLFKKDDIVIFPNGIVSKILWSTEDGELLGGEGDCMGHSNELRLFSEHIPDFVDNITTINQSERCKYWNLELEKTARLVETLYDVYEEYCGGLLHVLVDEDNIDPKTIVLSQYYVEMYGKDDPSYELCKTIALRYANHSLWERLCLTGDYFRCNNRACSVNLCDVEAEYQCLKQTPCDPS